MIVTRVDENENVYMLECGRIHEVIANSFWELVFKSAIIALKEFWEKM